jgi:hypothetical protein
LSAAVTKIREGAPPETVAETLDWVRFDRKEGAVFDLAQRAVAEQRALRQEGVVIPSFDRFIDALSQHVHSRLPQTAWRAAREMDHRLGQLSWIQQQQVFIRPGGSRPSWSPAGPTRRFGDVPAVGTDRVLYLHDGESWADERHERTVLGRDRCARPLQLD